MKTLRERIPYDGDWTADDIVDQVKAWLKECRRDAEKCDANSEQLSVYDDIIEELNDDSEDE